MSTHHHAEGCACCAGGRDKFMATLDGMIKQYGFAVVPTGHVLPDGTQVPMTYTVGLAEKGLPELVVFALSPQQAHQTLITTSLMLIDGQIKCCVPQEDIGNEPVYLMPLSPAQTFGYLNFAETRHGAPVKGLQIILYDEQNRFPWDAGFSKKLAHLQPLLYTSNPKKPFPLHEGGDDPVLATEILAQAHADVLEELLRREREQEEQAATSAALRQARSINRSKLH